MKFSTILAAIAVSYALYYLWLIVNDLFLKKDMIGLESIGDEEEIDVSEESANFQPEFISKPNASGQSTSDERNGRPLVINTGAIAIEDFVAMADDFAANGELSIYGQLCALWGAQ